jgi:hypothetical protein
MGRLTDDMTRLCGEIVSLRGARKSFVKDLCHDVATMKAAFRRAHKELSRANKAERAMAFADLKKTVAGLRHDFAADLEGARRAWAGK